MTLRQESYQGSVGIRSIRSFFFARSVLICHPLVCPLAMMMMKSLCKVTRSTWINDEDGVD